VQSDAKKGQDLHGQAAIRLNIASFLPHVDPLDLHGQAAIRLNLESFLCHVDHVNLHGIHKVLGLVGYVDLHGL